MRSLVIIFSVLLILFSFHHTQARIIHVPADSSTIQAGISGTVDGDTVLVAEGTYTGEGNRNISFMGKAIAVISQSRNPGACIIDCEGVSRGFHFSSGEGSESVLEGVTIQNGSARGVVASTARTPLHRRSRTVRLSTVRLVGVAGEFSSTGGPRPTLSVALSPGTVLTMAVASTTYMAPPAQLL